MKKIGNLILAGIFVFLAGNILLLLAGLLPQKAIDASIQESVEQLKIEYDSPYILYNVSRSRIDTFTDCLMLNLSMHMDTRTDPMSILSNPIWWTDELNPPDELIHALGESQANGNYINYCMGYRAWLRPMLVFMNYMEIRETMALALWVLFALVLINTYRVTQDRFFTMILALSIVALNPMAISGSLTYMTCFFITFAGMLLVPKIIASKRQWVSVELMFVILGATTQFFDFYTYPLITFAFPMIFLVWIKQSDIGTLSSRTTASLLGRCFLSWLLAYAGIWGAKMLAAGLLTDGAPAEYISRVIHSVLATKGVGLASRIVIFMKAVYYCALNILTPTTIAALIAVVSIWIIRFWIQPRKSECWSESWIFLAIAMLGILWIAVARRTFEHHFFQYRTLGVTLFGGLAFLARMVHNKKLKITE